MRTATVIHVVFFESIGILLAHGALARSVSGVTLRRRCRRRGAQRRRPRSCQVAGQKGDWDDMSRFIIWNMIEWLNDNGNIDAVLFCEGTYMFMLHDMSLFSVFSCLALLYRKRIIVRALSHFKLRALYKVQNFPESWIPADGESLARCCTAIEVNKN